MNKGGSSAAPKPDPNIGKAAALTAQTGADWLAFSKDAFKVSNERLAEVDELTKQVTQQQIGIAGEQAGWARADRERYESTFKPLEDKFVADAANYDSPEKQAEAAARASADVQSASAGARMAAERNAASLGLSPTSGRFQGIQRAGEMGTALADAGAQNNARTQVQDKGVAMRADAINLGRGLPSQSAQAAGLSLGAGSSAVGLNQQNTNLYNSSTGIVNAGYGGAQSGASAQAGILQGQYNGQVSAYNSQQQANAANSAGIGSAIGGIAGLFLSDEDLKEDKAEVPEGDALEAIENMPVEEWTYKEGVADEGRHVGPYAQDFQEQTGKGDGHSIAAQDAIGLTMKAVQDLSAKVDKLSDQVGLGVGSKKPAPAVKKPAPAAPKEQRPPMMRPPVNEPIGLGA